MNVKGVTIRFPQEMLDKLSYIADYEGRSVNSQVLVLVRESIVEFEEKHGKVQGTVSPEINVKPPRKG